MAGILNKGIELGYSTSGTSPITYTKLTNLQEIPDLGGSADSIEVTTFDDSAHMYINGLLDYGDSLDFKFLHDATQFATLAGLSGTVYWQVGLPDGSGGAIDTTATFSGECSVRIDGQSTNNALTYTLSIKPNSAITFA